MTGNPDRDNARGDHESRTPRAPHDDPTARGNSPAATPSSPTHARPAGDPRAPSDAARVADPDNPELIEREDG